jgi:hypothetical protein
MSDIFKNKLRKHDKVSDIVYGQVNYKISNHIKPIKIDHSALK